MQQPVNEIEKTVHNSGTWFGFNKSYISEFVYGGIDGAITTFAVVAGAAGAGIGMEVVLVLGFANLIADGFSMSVGNYFSTKASHDNFDKHRRAELWKVENKPDNKREEIREIYAKKGLEGDLLEQLVGVITSNKEVWVDTMMKEELEMVKEVKPPVKTAFITFVSFFVVGLIPLLSYLAAMFLHLPGRSLFLISCIATGIGLTIVGFLKSVVTEKGRFQGIIETVGLGGIAAALAYLVGSVLEQWVLN